MPILTPHAFEQRAPGDPYCKQCQLPQSNRLHAEGSRRVRVVMVLDAPNEMTDTEVHDRVLTAMELEPRLTVQDVQVLL